MKGEKERKIDFDKWSKYKRPYINAIKKMIAKRETGDWTKFDGTKTADPEEIFNDWIENN